MMTITPREPDGQATDMTRHWFAYADALERRNLRVKATFAAVYGSPGENSQLRLISDVMASQHNDGSWGSDDSPRLKPALTAQTIILLWRLGIRYNVQAGNETASLGAAHAIYRAVQWLEGVQREDGSWGEDSWDMCHVMEALFYCGYKHDEDHIDKGLRLLRSLVDGDWPDRSSYWYGPGFHGAAMIVFNAFGDPTYAKRALDQVWSYWNDELHCFQPHEDGDQSQRAPAAWHTACALLGLKSFGSVAPRPAQVDLAYTWLRAQQTQAGCWNPGHLEITCYTTKQVIAALAMSGYEENRLAARKGTDWFLTQCTPDGPLAVRLMAGFVVARTHAEELVTQVSFYFVTETSDLLDQYRNVVGNVLDHARDLEQRADESIASLESQRAVLASELSRYAIKLTERQLAVWGLIFAVISLAVGLSVAWL